MRAAICPSYGPPDVLRLIELPTPSPEADQVLIRIEATTVSSGDHRIRSLELPRGFGPIARLMFGLRRPRQPILGSELSGVIERVGTTVAQFKPGDRVVAFPDIRMGCHAEYTTMPESGALAIAPPRLTPVEAAAIAFGGTTALSFLRRAGVKEGDRVLIYGASGCVGTAAVQLARHFGAFVTGVASTANLDLVRRIGADEVIDYRSQSISDLGGGWDIVMDTVGTQPHRQFASLLAPHGRLLLIAADLPTMLSLLIRRWGRPKIIAGPSWSSPDDLKFLAALADSGAFNPVIDSIHPLGSIAEAHRRVASGRKRGSVVVTMNDARRPSV